MNGSLLHLFVMEKWVGHISFCKAFNWTPGKISPNVDHQKIKTFKKSGDELVILGECGENARGPPAIYLLSINIIHHTIF